MKVKDLTGQKFGRLTVVSRGENTKGGKCRWICDCECGKRKAKAVTAHDLESGKVQSCGCLYKDSNKDTNRTHGKTGERIYRIWLSMRQRCNYQQGREYHNYGGKGVSVCEEWSDFQSFYEWAIANCYRDDLTIDRKDGTKGYSPENCRWATMKEQQNNRSNNIRISINGEEKTISEWSKITGISRSTLEWRVKHNWTESELLMPVNLNNARIRKEKKNA